MEIVNRQINHQGKLLELGGYYVLGEINRGKNGIVYEAEDKYLRRKVAIKIWTKLKPRDKRDKIEQGIAEARKAFSANHERVIEIYHAGVTCGVFFMVMEYFDGITLKKYIHETQLPLGRRIRLARSILKVCQELHWNEIFHGDLHSKNVLIRNQEDMYLAARSKVLAPPTPDFKIIDFGTSLFVHQSFSEKRYFNQLISFADELSKPFTIKTIYGYAYPHSKDWDDRLNWIFAHYSYLPKALFKLGYIFTEEEYQSSFYTETPYQPPKEYLLNVEKIIKTGIPLNKIIDGWTLSALF